MAYGVKYQFSIESVNGDDVDIYLLQRNYSGQRHIRSLGRAPVLKRERNDCILGTSLEIFAECRVDGEFAELYTSDAYEFKVEVYKRQTLQWTGFVSPELYAEPDISPPFDVQIIATDGLGELKNYDFAFYDRAKSYIAYITSVLEHTGLDLDIEVISGLQYYDEGWSDSNGLGSIVVDLSHKAGESCYEILQQMLKSVNACITQHNGNWLVIRESDIYSQLGSFQIADFGSMNSCDWWPVGNMTTDVIPAKKHLSLTSENYYKPSVLKNSAMASDEGWDKEFNAAYDETEKAYILPDGGSNIRQTVNFFTEVGYRLFLHISARNAGDGSESQKIGVMIKINGRMYQAGDVFWLKELADAEGRYAWSNTEGYIEFELPEPSDSETRADATDIEVVIPLYKYDLRSYAYATSIEVTIFNADGIHDIYVYECSLMQYEQPLGHKIEASIANGARESMPNVGLLLNDGTYAKPSAEIFRNAIPVAYESEAIITQWKTSAVSAGTYLSVMAKDFAMQVALPRLRYKGNLNVPANQSLPMLFYRDGTYYFLNTYSYDLLNDEVEVELISIPNAAVIIESETITELSPTTGGGSGNIGVAGGGDNNPGIIVDSEMSDESTNPVGNKTIKSYVDSENRRQPYFKLLGSAGDVNIPSGGGTSGGVAGGGSTTGGSPVGAVRLRVVSDMLYVESKTDLSGATVKFARALKKNRKSFNTNGGYVKSHAWRVYAGLSEDARTPIRPITGMFSLEDHPYGYREEWFDATYPYRYRVVVGTTAGNRYMDATTLLEAFSRKVINLYRIHTGHGGSYSAKVKMAVIINGIFLPFRFTLQQSGSGLQTYAISPL